MIDLHPLALAVLRADRDAVKLGQAAVKGRWDRAFNAWKAADCPIEIPPPDRAGFVRVRIAVSVGADGEYGVDRADDVDKPASHLPGGRLTYIEAWVPKPAAPWTVEGEVAGE